MRYQFQSEQGDFSFRPRIFTEAIKILIGANIIIFLLKIISQNPATPFFNPIVDLFGLSSSTVWPRIWQPFTYLFIHKDFLHVFFNMFVLWMFVLIYSLIVVLRLSSLDYENMDFQKLMDSFRGMFLSALLMKYLNIRTRKIYLFPCIPCRS